MRSLSFIASSLLDLSVFTVFLETPTPSLVLPAPAWPGWTCWAQQESWLLGLDLSFSNFGSPGLHILSFLMFSSTLPGQWIVSSGTSLRKSKWERNFQVLHIWEGFYSTSNSIDWGLNESLEIIFIQKLTDISFQLCRYSSINFSFPLELMIDKPILSTPPFMWSPSLLSLQKL